MRTPRRLTAVAVLLVTALGGSLSLVTPSDAAPSGGDRSVARAADRYGISESALRERLQEDETLRLAPNGAAYFVDAGPTAGPQSTGVAPQAFPLADTFLLHSKPGSPRTIYLDFNGHTVSNTYWNVDLDGPGPGTAVPNGTHPAWDPAGDGAAFSDPEKVDVQSIFQRVAEDYAPFDVDVTTEEPAAAAIERADAGDQVYGTRALIGPSTATNNICGGGCGGVAFIGVFDYHQGLDPNFPNDTHGDFQPAWVFTQNLGPDDVKAIAEATTHEVGHNLGLDHDATTTQNYYAGHDPWAPIMGVAYDEPISQFALNDYPNARLGNVGRNSLQSNPDDIVAVAQFGAVLRPDEAPANIATAGAMPVGTAYIRNRVDTDVYALGACSGSVTIDADPAPVSPNLDIKLDLLAANGSVVATSNPASAKLNFDVASGMDASISKSVPAGNYYVRIDGVGRGTATNGYTDYGSIGAYTLMFSGCDGIVPPPPTTNPPGKTRIGKATPGKRGGKLTAKVTWQPPVAAANPAINGYQVVAYRKNSDGKYVKVSTSPVFGAAARSAKFTAGKRGSYKFAVRARNSLGFGPLSAKSNAVRPR
jgi:hypothetical protein